MERVKTSDAALTDGVRASEAAARLKLGLAMCGSYCTFDAVFEAVERLALIYDVIPIMSERAAVTNTRFGKAADFEARLSRICNRDVIKTIEAAEPFGPVVKPDALFIAPCTGNTMAKLAGGITDGCVTMAAKATMRNGKPIILAPSTNDGLTNSAQNLGKLLARKNVFFVPFRQDDPIAKPGSVMADFTLSEAAVAAAIRGEQLQPVLAR